MNPVDPHNRGVEAIRMSHQYTWRQQKKMFPVTVGLVFLMTAYTVMTYSFVPLLNLNLVSWVIVMFMIFISRKRLNEQFIEYLKCQQTGREMDWKMVTYNAWWLYGCTVVMLYWLAIMGWISFFAPEDIIYSMYNIDPPANP